MLYISQMTLATSGRPLGLKVFAHGSKNSENSNDVSISHEALRKMQAKRNLSDRAMKDVAATIHSHLVEMQ